MPAKRSDSRAPRTAGHRIQCPCPWNGTHPTERRIPRIGRPRILPERSERGSTSLPPELSDGPKTRTDTGAFGCVANTFGRISYPLFPFSFADRNGTTTKRRKERQAKEKRRERQKKIRPQPMETEKRERERLFPKQIQPCRNGLRQGCNPSESPGSGQSDRPETERV